MSYDYQKEKRNLFTENGLKTLIKVRDNSIRLSNISEVFTLEKMISNCSGGSWTMLAAVDYLEELGEIKCVHSPGSTQKKIYVRK